MGDWSILGRFLVEVQNHSTVIGKIWLTVLLIFRILLVTLIGDAVYSDEQSKFVCNTLQPGCNNVCYDTFAPVSHLRFWVFQIVLVSTPSIFYIIYALHKITDDENARTERAPAPLHHPLVEYVKQSGGESNTNLGGKPSNELQDGESPSEKEGVEQSLLQNNYEKVGKDPTEYSGQILLIYIIHVVFRSILEIMFLVGQYYMFGFKVPFLFLCKAYPCPTQTDCFVSRATEKTIFLNFMFSTSLGCFLLNIAELHYLGWVYIFRILYRACIQCWKSKRKVHAFHDPWHLKLRHSGQDRLVLQSFLATLSPEKTTNATLSHGQSVAFQIDSECTLKTNPEKKTGTGVQLSNIAKLSSKKSWL